MPPSSLLAITRLKQPPIPTLSAGGSSLLCPQARAMTRRLGSLVPLPSPFLPSLTLKRGTSICQKPKKYRWVFPFPHSPRPGHQHVLSSHLQNSLNPPTSLRLCQWLLAQVSLPAAQGDAILCPLPEPLRPPGPAHKPPATPQLWPSGPSAGHRKSHPRLCHLVPFTAFLGAPLLTGTQPHTPHTVPTPPRSSK